MSSDRSSSRVVVQARDILVLRGLFESRIMTLAHLTTLFFEDRRDAAKKRLWKLKTAKLVRERPRRPYEPSVLSITPQAFRFLRDNGHLNGYPKLPLKDLEQRGAVSQLNLRHELGVMDVKTAFSKAIFKLQKWNLVEFCTWPRLSEFAIRRTTRIPSPVQSIVKPDAFVRVEERNDEAEYEYSFFVELDRSTETQATLGFRCACYADYYRSGDFAVWRGGRRETYQEYPFRVLVICQTQERRNNAAERMLLNDPPIRTMVWLTTFDEVISNPLGAIWIRPGDYSAATAGTTFTPTDSARVTYRRRLDRDAHIERSLKKLPLFDSFR